MRSKQDRSPTTAINTRTVFRLVLCLFLVSLAGCATRRTVLVNERGDELTCETRGYGFIAAIAATSQESECVTDAEKRGYRVKQQDR